jgi:hypothetical protein
LVDYLGLPLSQEGRARALAYDQDSLSMPERQCLYYTPQYVVFGPQGLKIWSESDPATGNIVAWKISAVVDRDMVTIWMDGRPHPSKNAYYPLSGFTTGVWEGDTLTTFTDHIKAGYLRRNGAPSSDRATVTEHIFRRGDLLTIMAIIEDPIYLTEPLTVTRTWELDPRSNIPTTVSPCFSFEELPNMDKAPRVPHFLPNKNPFVSEFADEYHLPVEAVLGGAETMYPEYRKKLKDKYVRPEKCTHDCCLGAGALNAVALAGGNSCPQ